LAPDKIVFRDGWSKDSAFLLLNLRFSGWHRYKATNTITLFYKSKPLVSEEMSGKTMSWLPTGRSLFRDKRIPRENLNGLLVERTGMSAVLYELTGAGGPWAQDPPYYAQVEEFEAGPEMDVSSTLIQDWHGWRQRRKVYFYHPGPVVIVDQVIGPSDHSAAITWHVTGEVTDKRQRIRLGDTELGAEMVLLPIGMNEKQTSLETRRTDEGRLAVSYKVSTKGRLSLVTLLLTDEWTGAGAELAQDSGKTVLRIEKDEKRIHLPLNLDLDQSS
jgi:hypothetical protein